MWSRMKESIGGLPMRSKFALFGAGVLALGGVAGYALATARDRSISDNDFRGRMFRDDASRNWSREGDDSRWGQGMGQSDGNGYGNQQGSSASNGSQGNGKNSGGGNGVGGGMMNGAGGGGMMRNRDNCVADECLSVDGLEYPVGTLSDEAKSAVLAAIDDEYKAHATYSAVIEKLGSVRPFIMIIRAEEQHIASLKAILDKYGIATPSDPWSGKVVTPDTVAAACQIGADAEIANAALYRNDLLPKVTSYADITSVFTNLMNASQDHHLPAFERCK